MMNNMFQGKAIVFLPDGMADEPITELNDRTPLEAVDTPFMDMIARNGASGTFLTLPEGFPTSSDAANMSVLGYSLAQFYPGRGPIEAAAQGIELAPDDIAWRCNLINVKDGILKDYSAGHIPNEISSALINDLQKHFGSGKITFYPGVSYRNLLILHGKEFSANITYEKPDANQDNPIAPLALKPMDDTPEAKYTADFLNELSMKSIDFLSKHPLNQGRDVPANMIWPWSPGHRPHFNSFSEKYNGKRAAIISAVDVIKGIGRCAGMDVIEVPGATGFLDTNYEGKAKAALDALKDHDLVYLHVEATDECSHMGDLKLKMQAISDFENKIMAPVMKALENQGVTFAILPDHPVPLKTRNHTRTPVPFSIWGNHIQPDSVTVYSEKDAKNGSLGYLSGEAFMRKVMNLK